MNSKQVELSVKRTVSVLFGIALMLTIADLVAIFLVPHFVDSEFVQVGVEKVFSVDLEGSLPSYFSSFILLFIAAILAMIFGQVRSNSLPYSTHWGLLAIIFMVLSVDESTSLHEKSIQPMQAVLGTGGFFFFAGVVPAAIFVVVFAVCYLRFFLALPTNAKVGFALSAGLYVGGALGMEMLCGPFFEAGYEDTAIYLVLTRVEELFEILGAVLFVYVLLGYLRTNFPDARLTVRD